jgi:hypothetical protein
MNYIFKISDIERMIEHWMNAPPNGYIGVTYGRNKRELLHKPMTEDSANTLLDWMREDMPILRQLSDADFSVVEQELGYDKKAFFIQLSSILIPIPTRVDDNILGA